jgi:hypothetical protein
MTNQRQRKKIIQKQTNILKKTPWIPPPVIILLFCVGNYHGRIKFKIQSVELDDDGSGVLLWISNLCHAPKSPLLSRSRWCVVMELFPRYSRTILSLYRSESNKLCGIINSHSSWLSKQHKMSPCLPIMDMSGSNNCPLSLIALVC